MKNKKGAWQATLLVLIVLMAFILIIGYFVYTGLVSQQAIGGAGQVTTDGGITIVTTDEIIAIAGHDAQLSGTEVTTTGSKYSKDSENGFSSVTLGTTPAKVGTVIRLLLVNNTAYHNQVWNKDGAIETQVGTFKAEVNFNKNGSMNENIYSTTGVVMTNGVEGGAINQTDLGNAQSYTWKDEMTPESLTNTQEMVCVVEITAGVNASTSPAGVVLKSSDGKASVTALDTSIPTWYAVNGTDSRIWRFTVGALNGGETYTFNIGLKADTSKRFSPRTFVKKSCYSKEWFVDPNTGKLVYDVADSQGTLKSMASHVYRAFFVA